MSVLDKSISRWAGVIVVLVICSKATNSDAAALALTSLSGAISYGYGYTKAGGGGEGESQTISASISGSGFYWQPWFISYSASLTGAFNRSDSSTASSSSNAQALGGSLGINVFPVSRFPFSLSVSHTNSILENTQSFSGTASRTFSSTRLLARQSYLARSGYNSNLTWSHGRFDSEDSKSTSDVYTADTRKTFTNSSILASANYTTSEDSNSTIKPQNWGLQFNHNYVPGNQFGLSSFISTSGSKADSPNSVSQSQTSQASSSFSWRPEYKPYSFSGGVRIAYNENSQKTDVSDNKSSSNVASLSLGVNYRVSRKIAVFITGGGSGGYDKNGGTETTHTSGDASVGTSYSSDQYSILGFQYGWNVGGGVGGTTSSTKTSGGSSENDSSETSSSVGLNVGHNASRSWSVGRTTVLGLSLSQSLGESVNDKGRGGFGLGTGLSFSGSTRGESGSSFAGISLSHSYSESDSEQQGVVITAKSESLFASLNISRNQTINRLSAVTANAGVQASRQVISDQDPAINRTGNANLSYRHLRVFGIYALLYNSTAGYSLLFNPDEDNIASMFWNNSFQYNVGLLDMALDVDLNKEGNGSTRGSLRFRATRSF